MERKEKKGKTVQFIFWIVLLIVIWEIASRAGILNQYLVPPFSKVVIRLFKEIFEGVLGIQIINSLVIVLFGFCVSFALAILVSIVCIYSKVAESFFGALCTIMNPLPGMAILPIIMMWFGVGDGAMLVLIIHGVLWPLITNLTAGFQAIPSVYKEWGINIELKPLQMLVDIYVGAVMTYIISGLRVGWGRAWRALISAEMVFGMIGDYGGVGYYIYESRAYANSTNVMAGVVAIIIVGLFMEQGIFRIIEKNTIEKWEGR